MAPNHVDYVFCSLSICMLCFVVIIWSGRAFCKWDDLVRKERQAKSQAIQIWRLVLWLLVELAFGGHLLKKKVGDSHSLKKKWACVQGWN
jgi:hypothetical protein